MKRQPSVVSCSFISPRANADSALPSTNGARVMLSTPPASQTSPSPAWMAWAARVDRLQAGAAEPVHRLPGDRRRQPGQQQRHARDVAIILARLVGAAHDHVFDNLSRNARALDRLANTSAPRSSGRMSLRTPA